MNTEKARILAEAKAAEDARKRAEAEAEAEAKRKRELEREVAREAARQALLEVCGAHLFCRKLLSWFVYEFELLFACTGIVDSQFNFKFFLSCAIKLS